MRDGLDGTVNPLISLIRINGVTLARLQSTFNCDSRAMRLRGWRLKISISPASQPATYIQGTTLNSDHGQLARSAQNIRIKKGENEEQIREWLAGPTMHSPKFLVSSTCSLSPNPLLSINNCLFKHRSPDLRIQRTALSSNQAALINGKLESLFFQDFTSRLLLLQQPSQLAYVINQVNLHSFQASFMMLVTWVVLSYML